MGEVTSIDCCNNKRIAS